ncbi:uncharacterized protein LOC121429251 isoform X1 [Lytechinus variegatus]|nr:uncharacterized protein LOC121429251 isoform X1 [Lytechinus variegatus]
MSSKKRPVSRTSSSSVTDALFPGVNLEQAEKDAVLKEGTIDKESSSLFYPWRPKFCVLTPENLTIFRWHSKKKSSQERVRNILYRMPLDDVTAIANIAKGKKHIHFTMVTKDGTLDLRVGLNNREWLTQIQMAVLARKNRRDFVKELKTRSSVVANKFKRKALRRRSFTKDPEYGDGIGITIKNEGETIVVARLFSDGPAAKKGTLKIGDEIIEVNGRDVHGHHAEKVASIIKSQTDKVILMIKSSNSKISVGTQSEYRHTICGDALKRPRPLSIVTGSAISNSRSRRPHSYAHSSSSDATGDPRSMTADLLKSTRVDEEENASGSDGIFRPLTRERHPKLSRNSKNLSLPL